MKRKNDDFSPFSIRDIAFLFKGLADTYKYDVVELRVMGEQVDITAFRFSGKISVRTTFTLSQLAQIRNIAAIWTAIQRQFEEGLRVDSATLWKAIEEEMREQNEI